MEKVGQVERRSVSEVVGQLRNVVRELDNISDCIDNELEGCLSGTNPAKALSEKVSEEIGLASCAESTLRQAEEVGITLERILSKVRNRIGTYCSAPDDNAPKAVR